MSIYLIESKNICLDIYKGGQVATACIMLRVREGRCKGRVEFNSII